MLKTFLIFGGVACMGASVSASPARDRRWFKWKRPSCETKPSWSGASDCIETMCAQPTGIQVGKCVKIDLSRGCGCFPNTPDQDAFNSGEMNVGPDGPRIGTPAGFGEEALLAFSPESFTKKSFYAFQVKSDTDSKFFGVYTNNYVDVHYLPGGFRGDDTTDQCKIGSDLNYVGTIFDSTRYSAPVSGTQPWAVQIISGIGADNAKSGVSSDYRILLDDRQVDKFHSTKVEAQVDRLFEYRERGCCRVNYGQGTVNANTEDYIEVPGAVKEKDCAALCVGYKYVDGNHNRRCVGIETSKKNGGYCELHFKSIVDAVTNDGTTCVKANCYRRTDYEFEFVNDKHYQCDEADLV